MKDLVQGPQGRTGKTAPTRSSTARGLSNLGLIAGGVLCWLVCTIAQVEKYLSLSLSAAVCIAGCVGVALVFLLLKRGYRAGRDIGSWSLFVVFGILALSFAVLYPKSQRHLAGKGSDREDALRVELQALTHHQYPYDARTYLGHPPTPLPGAMLLALPFYLAGKVALQNLLWAAVFLWFLKAYFRRRYTAFAFALLFLLFAPENLNDFDVGGDYMTNILYVCVAMYAFTLAVRRRSPALWVDWRTILSVLLLGVTLSSRVIYVVALLPLLAFALQHTPMRRAVALGGSVAAVLLATTLPVFAPHPMTRLLDQLQQNSDKLQILPSYLPAWSLVAAALLVGALCFFTKMNLAKVYLFTSLASLILLLPPMVLFVRAQGGLLHPVTTDLEYVAVSAVFLALWIFFSWEQHYLPNLSDDSAIL